MALFHFILDFVICRRLVVTDLYCSSFFFLEARTGQITFVLASEVLLIKLCCRQNFLNGGQGSQPSKTVILAIQLSLVFFCLLPVVPRARQDHHLNCTRDGAGPWPLDDNQSLRRQFPRLVWIGRFSYFNCRLMAVQDALLEGEWVC